MSHLKKGPGGHLAKTAGGHLSKSCKMWRKLITCDGATVDIGMTLAQAAMVVGAFSFEGTCYLGLGEAVSTEPGRVIAAADVSAEDSCEACGGGEEGPCTDLACVHMHIIKYSDGSTYVDGDGLAWDFDLPQEGDTCIWGFSVVNAEYEDGGTSPCGVSGWRFLGGGGGGAVPYGAFCTSMNSGDSVHFPFGDWTDSSPNPDYFVRFTPCAMMAKRGMTLGLARKKWPLWAKGLALLASHRDAGVGDVMARWGRPVEWLMKWVGKKTACRRCASRRALWNARFPLRHSKGD